MPRASTSHTPTPAAPLLSRMLVPAEWSHTRLWTVCLRAAGPQIWRTPGLACANATWEGCDSRAATHRGTPAHANRTIRPPVIPTIVRQAGYAGACALRTSTARVAAAHRRSPRAAAAPLRCSSTRTRRRGASPTDSSPMGAGSRFAARANRPYAGPDRPSALTTTTPARRADGCARC